MSSGREAKAGDEHKYRTITAASLCKTPPHYTFAMEALAIHSHKLNVVPVPARAGIRGFYLRTHKHLHSINTAASATNSHALGMLTHELRASCMKEGALPGAEFPPKKVGMPGGRWA